MGIQRNLSEIYVLSPILPKLCQIMVECQQWLRQLLTFGEYPGDEGVQQHIFYPNNPRPISPAICTGHLLSPTVYDEHFSE